MIYSYVFNGCTNLKSVIIPDSVTYIDEGVFKGCSNLETIYFEGTEAQWDNIKKSTLENTALFNADIVYNYSN